MSTIDRTLEQKEQTSIRRDKDDVKQQAHLKKAETKPSDINVKKNDDVGKKDSAKQQQGGFEKPQKLNDDKEQKKPVDEKQAGGAGIVGNVSAAVSNLASTVSEKLNAVTTGVSSSVSSVGTTLSNAPANIKETLQHNKIAYAYEEKGLAKAASVAMKEARKAVSGTVSSATKTVGLGAQPIKKHGKRRRGGRGHGNRKMKLRLIDHKAGESILDSLGDEVKKIKPVEVDGVKLSSVPASSSTSGGIMDSLMTRTSGILGSISSAASSILPSKASTADVSKNQSKAASSISKPELDRKNELPALGTPQSPEIDSTGPKLKASVGDQSTLLQKASFAKDQLVGGLKTKIDNMSMNADDDKGNNNTVLEKASKQLNDLKAKVSK